MGRRKNGSTTNVPTAGGATDATQAVDIQPEVLLDVELESVESQSEKSIVVRTLVAQYNDAVANGDMAVATSLDKQLLEALKALNAEERATQIENWLGTSDPVVSALIDGGTYRLTAVKRNKETGLIDDIIVKTAVIDLRDIYMVNKTVFHDQNWLAYCEAANVAIRDFMVKVLGIKHMTDKLKGFQLTATSKMLGISIADMKTAKGCTGALQKVIDSIFGTGRYTVTAEDAEVFRYTYATWGTQNALSVKLSIESTFRKILTRIMVRIVNELGYTGE